MSSLAHATDPGVNANANNKLSVAQSAAAEKNIVIAERQHPERVAIFLYFKVPIKTVYIFVRYFTSH